MLPWGGGLEGLQDLVWGLWVSRFRLGFRDKACRGFRLRSFCWLRMARAGPEKCRIVM